METGANLFVNRITADPVFTASSYNDGTGLITINKAGQVLSVEVSVTRSFLMFWINYQMSHWL